MKKIKKFLLLPAIAVCCMTAVHARADSDLPIATATETNFVGVAAVFVPDYVGSDDSKLGAMPAFRYEFGDNRNIELIGNFLSANLINDDVIHFGPALRYRMGRDNDVEDDVVKLLPEIDDTLEAGATLSGTWIMDGDPRNRFSAGIDALWDTGDTHEGFTGTVFARYWTPVSQSVDLGISGNLQYGDENFTNTYFGVTPAGSAASGLPVYNADAGLTSFSIQPMVAFHLTQNWHIGAGVRYQKLMGDASDSPIVDGRGSTSQVIGGLGVIYTWGDE